ncbi:MAG: serine hydrolase [Anaerolineae bacterium]|nr:serine hydrolase [Anaerolineae bacterium]
MKMVVRFSLWLALLALGAATALAQDETEDSDVESSLALIWELVSDQPQDVGIGCVPLNEPDRAVFYNADEPFPLASVSKLLIFIEYARRVDIGEISWSETVDVAVLDRYNLPRTDRGAHDRFMTQYPPDIQQIYLSELAIGMMQYSSNAASDYLLDRLAPVDWASLYRSLSISHTDPPHSLTMIPLLMNNHETGKAGLRDIPSLSIETGERLLDLYVSDEAWREDEIEYRSGRGSQFPIWSIQAAILEADTASGTVRDFLSILRLLYTPGVTNGLSENVKAATRSALRWIGNPYIDERYAAYGSKLGFYSGGTLTLVAYGDPLLGDPVLSAVFFRDIPRRTYNFLLEEDAIGHLAHWMNFNGCAGLADAIADAVGL